MSPLGVSLSKSRCVCVCVCVCACVCQANPGYDLLAVPDGQQFFAG